MTKEVAGIRVRYDCNSGGLSMTGLNGNYPDDLRWSYIGSDGQTHSDSQQGAHTVYLPPMLNEFELHGYFDDFGTAVDGVIKSGRFSSNGYNQCENNGVMGCDYEGA